MIQSIAAANTEQLRLTQKASGMMILDMKNARDGAEDDMPEDDTQEDGRARNDAALADTAARINRLEQMLSSLDEELEAAIKEKAE